MVIVGLSVVCMACNKNNLKQQFGLIMYNSFIFKKHSLQQRQQQTQIKRKKKWKSNYINSIRPALIEKYSRRINNFVVRLEEDKKELYEYREETQSKARELLKEIYHKERYLGAPYIKLRDTKDWNSILSTTDRIELEKNKSIFEAKYGNSDIAFRSIASQSAYNPSASNEFRGRSKQKEIHPRNMRFCYRSESFSNNKKQKAKHYGRTQSSAKSQQNKDYIPKRLNSNHSNPSGDEQNRSRAHSVFSFGGDYQRGMEQPQQSNSLSKQMAHPNAKQPKNSKIYFKQVIDLQQNLKDGAIRKSLHQILVRFGVSRIKDVKKQAMMETDKLSSDDF